jgi:hypothetical protein
MRKSTLFISAALTTFMLAVLAAGVASAYQTVINKTDSLTSQSQQAQQQPVSGVADTLPVTASAQATSLTPEQAAQLAAQVIGRTDLYSVETTTLNGAQAYLVTFSSGDLVYVSPTGQILSITKLQALSTSATSGGGGKPRDDKNGGGHEGGESGAGESGGGDD